MYGMFLLMYDTFILPNFLLGFVDERKKFVDIDQRPRYVKRKFNIKSRVCNWNGIDSKKVFLDRKIVVYLWEFSITAYYGP